MGYISPDAWTCPHCGLTYARRYNESKKAWKTRLRELRDMICEETRR